jgi:hypothetical protein
VDELAVLFALALGGIILVTPVVALIMAYTSRRALQDLRGTVDVLQTRLERSEWWIGELNQRLERGASPTATATATAMPTATTKPAVTVPETATAPATSIPSAEVPAEPALPPRLAPPPPLPPPAPPRAFDLEKLVGVRLFAWLGGIGLFIGAAFFLEYSIEHDLIAPPMRVGIGFLVGAVAIALGDYLRAKADRAGQALAGAGVATLYASLFAARSLYQLIPSWGAFVGMALVTALAGVIAIRRDAFVLAVIGLLGGFATPWLLSTGEDHRYAFFAYVALLDAGVLVVAAKRKWVSLPALAFAGTLVLYGGWAAEYLDAGGVVFALVVAAILAALFVASDLLRARAERTSIALRMVSIAALAGPFVAALIMAGLELRASLPLLTGYLAVLLLGVLLLVRNWRAPWLLEGATVLSVVTLAARIRADLLQGGPTELLVTLSAIPALLFGLYVWRRSSSGPEAAPLQRSAAMALVGSWLMVLLSYGLASVDGVAAPVAPFALYAAAHVAGIVAIGLLESATMWLVLAQATWLLVLVMPFAMSSDRARLGEIAPFILAPMLAFFALPLVTARARADKVGWIAAASSLVTHYAVLYWLARTVWPDAALGAGAIVASALSLGMMTYARPRVTGVESKSVVATLGGVTLLFLSAAVPITLSKQWITVAWALETASLAWLYLRIRHRGLLLVSALLAASTTVRLLGNPWLWEYHARSGTIVVNWYLYTFGLPALAFFAAAFLLRGDDDANRWHLPRALWAAGGVIAFVLLNVEIADAYSTGETIGVHLGASLGEDMTYSLGWGTFGIVTLLLGIRFRAARVRMCALAVLLLTIAKVFLHDLWHLGALYRVGSMVGLAIALLLVSFLTQRFILRGDRS